MLKNSLLVSLGMLGLCTQPSPAQQTGIEFVNDDTAELVGEEEGVVETVKLGGEEQTNIHEGVVQDDASAANNEDAYSPSQPDSKEPISAAPLDNTPIKPILTEADMALQDPSRVAYASTRKNARTMSLTVPAPRGVITDRNGELMACSEIAYQPAIDFGQLEDESEGNILSIARQVMSDYEKLGFKINEKSDEKLLDHYRNRRWLPLPIGPTVREKEYAPRKAKAEAIPHGHIVALYIRRYPAKETAAHILGYTGVQAKLPTGPINHNDPIFAKQEGRSGLEATFNKQLTGKPGIWRLMFDETGKKILDELQTKPKPGGAVVTTLHLEWQKAAEKALKNNTKGRGAFVLIDVRTGEVLVMATQPNFDPNIFIPSISQKDYDELRNDPRTPLVSRAFAGIYPPASTFKTVTVAAGLRYGMIKESTYIYCPYSVRIGNHEFKNHNRFEGSINCVTALVLSNNPFMYQIAATREPRIGAVRLCELARRMGYGSVTGLPIADKKGNVPTEAWMHRNYGRGFMQGDAANMAIGQGPLLATPLQVAHAIAGIANGTYLPKLQLIRQMLDSDGNVVYQFTPTVQNNLSDMAPAFEIVRKGMKAVVNGGTGRRAALSYVSSAGKTGTAQWGPPSEDRRLAWFAGFLPADNPRYAYAALYEGGKGQRISGGHMAAAIVRSFFESIKPSMQAALEEPTISINVGGENEEEPEEVSEEDTERRAQEEQEEIKAQRAEEAQRIRQQKSGWDDDQERR